jgi:enoyl-CoA hydratase/carnithine racemase
VLDGGSSVMRTLLQDLYIGLYNAQHDLGKPSIAAVRGIARGGGMTIALSCDVVLAADTATFGYPELNVGILPGLHFTHLPRIVGRHKAFELLFAGEPFDATEALAMGLVNRTMPPGDLMAAAMTMAREFTRKPAGAVKLARDNFMRINDRDYRSQIASVVDTMAGMIDGQETQDALRRFLKRD